MRGIFIKSEVFARAAEGKEKDRREGSDPAECSLKLVHLAMGKFVTRGEMFLTVYEMQRNGSLSNTLGTFPPSCSFPAVLLVFAHSL